MFASLFKKSIEDAPSDQFEFSVARQNRPPLRFNGTVQFESLGKQLADYTAGDPYHNLKIYKLRENGYAVVVEFQRDSELLFAEAATVESLADVDDFFCLHAGDYFHHMSFESGDDAEQNKSLEQRVLKCYDRQLLDVGKYLSIVAPGMITQ